MEYLGAWETLIHEKKRKSKISCQAPFNQNYAIADKEHLSKGKSMSNFSDSDCFTSDSESWC